MIIDKVAYVACFIIALLSIGECTTDKVVEIIVVTIMNLTVYEIVQHCFKRK